MPKMKTNKGAAKRFKVKKSGQIKRGYAYRSHILTKKSQKRKRNFRAPHYIDNTDVKEIKVLLGK